jgi:hypothetical protein
LGCRANPNIAEKLGLSQATQSGPNAPDPQQSYQVRPPLFNQALTPKDFAYFLKPRGNICVGTHPGLLTQCRGNLCK